MVSWNSTDSFCKNYESDMKKIWLSVSYPTTNGLTVDFEASFVTSR